MEEYHSILVCPLVDGWSVADDEWADDIGGIPCPDILDEDFWLHLRP
jgi:hypothetical protein